mgnify:CR=1 FL=1
MSGRRSGENRGVGAVRGMFMFALLAAFAVLSVIVVLVGIGTALADNPLLTTRPPGPRVATRVIVDSRARLPVESQLVRTCRQTPPAMR